MDAGRVVPPVPEKAALFQLRAEFPEFEARRSDHYSPRAVVRINGLTACLARRF